MNQFVFEGRQKMLFLGMMGVGLLCMLLTFFVADDELHTRFWTNYLHNATFFTGIAFVTLFFVSACITAWAGWYVQMKRIWESFFMFLAVGGVLMLILIAGLWLGWHDIYHWADPESVAEDSLLQSKSGFLNKGWYTFGTIIIVAVWYFLFARPLYKMSVREDAEGGTTDFKLHKRMRIFAAAFLPVGGFTSAALIWQWLMSVDAHWYSTLYAWYATASWFVSAMALTILLILYFKGKGYFQGVTAEHIHDLGKYLFAFSIFWTYLWFSQYMLIWYGNIGEETVYYQTRQNEYPVLFYGNLILNFIVPFFILMRNDTKRKVGTMALTAGIVLFGHWIDFFLMIKPGALHTAHELMGHGHHGAEGAHEAGAHGGEHAAEGLAHAAEHASTFAAGFTIPGLLELGTFIGFLGLFLYFVFNQMTKASLIPKNDPFIQESLHHHV